MSDHSATAFEIYSGGLTDKGKSRDHNEDAIAFFEASATDIGGLSAPIHVAVVADGIGGAAGGQQASLTAVEIIERTMRGMGNAIEQRLGDAVGAANGAIFEAALKDSALAGMGTTVVVAAIYEGSLYLAHAGDSRAYLLRGGTLYQLTTDHTWVEEAVSAGRISEEEAKRHPNRHVVRRYLGSEAVIDIDQRIQSPSGPSLFSLPLHPNDTILLCTDGLTDLVSDEALQEIITDHPQPQAASQALVDAANDAGGTDNITAALMRVQPAGAKAPAAARSALPVSPLIIGALLLIAALAAGGWFLRGAGGGSLSAADASATALSLALATGGAEGDLALVDDLPTSTSEPVLEVTNEAGQLVTSTPLAAAITLLGPAEGATVGGASVRFLARVERLQVGNEVRLLLGKNSTLGTPDLLTTIDPQKDGSAFAFEVPKRDSLQGDLYWSVGVVRGGELVYQVEPSRKLSWRESAPSGSSGGEPTTTRPSQLTSTPRPVATTTTRPGEPTSTPRPATATSAPATATPRPAATATPRPAATATPRPAATNTPRPAATNPPPPPDPTLTPPDPTIEPTPPDPTIEPTPPDPTPPPPRANKALSAPVARTRTPTVELKTYLPLVARNYPPESESCLFNNEREPNNTIPEALERPLLCEGDLISGRMLEVSDSTDYYRINVEQAGWITIDLQELPSDSDFNLYLYLPDGTFLAQSFNPSNQDERIVYEVTSTGFYMVRVYPVDGSRSKGAYKVFWHYGQP